MTAKKTSPIYLDPAKLLQELIRFDTTNPPGNERQCIQYIHRHLRDAGINSKIIAKTPARPNVIARLKGEGNAPPLLLYGHVDVVTTQNQQWTHPPFEARNVDGFIWGRGALDMKSGVAMFLAAFLKAKAEKLHLPGDVIFAALADEEAGDDYGARYLVNNHPFLFKDVRYALGEFGGFNLTMGGKCFYPIMIAEKQICWLKLTFHGRGGHGSMPVHGQAMLKLARVLKVLDQRSLPVHITPSVRLMLKSLAIDLGGINGYIIKQVLKPTLTHPVLKLLGKRGDLFMPILHNTVSPTTLMASDKVNVIPEEVTLGLDGRLVPGAKPEDLIQELKNLIGEETKIEVVKTEPGPSSPEMGLFDVLGDSLQELDPRGIPLPFVLSGVTDARFFSKLRIQTYGFTPLQLPEDFNFISTVHAADERVPVKALDFGAQAVYSVLQKFH